MSVEHFQEILLRLMERKPFRPFIVELATGERFEIDHPHATVWREGVAMFIGPGRVFHYFDNESVTEFIDHTADASR